MNPQIFGVVMDRLYAAGALEVFYVPVQMKKNRPGTLLTVIALPSGSAQISDIIFRETTTIGLRHSEVDARVSGARDRHGRDAARRRALQGRAARRPRHERRAGIRGLREAGRREQSLGQGSAGAWPSQAYGASQSAAREPLLPHHRHRLRQQPARISGTAYEKIAPTSSRATSGSAASRPAS